MKTVIIVAMTQDRIIGRKGRVPWHLPDDLRFFKRTTTGHAIIMGRKTFQSIGRPLPARRNIVVTTQGNDAPWMSMAATNGIEPDHQDARNTVLDVVHSPQEAVDLCRKRNETKAFIIGGGQIYAQMLPLADEMVITRIEDENVEGDTFFPEWNEAEWICVGQADVSFPLAFLYRRIAKDDCGTGL